MSITITVLCDVISLDCLLEFQSPRGGGESGDEEPKNQQKRGKNKMSTGTGGEK